MITAARGSAATAATPAFTDAAAVQATFFGLNPTGDVLPYIREGGSIRPWTFSWTGTSNPSSGVFNLAQLSTELARAQALGNDILIILAVHSFPTWAQGSSATVLPNMTAFAAWCTAIAQLVATTSVTAYYEVYNEINGTSHWTDTYANAVVMAQTASQAIKAVTPSAKIVAPSVYDGQGTSPSAASWLSGFLGAGGDAYTDIYNVHSYQVNSDTTNGESLLTTLQNVQSVLSGAGITKPLWCTEAAWCGVAANTASYGPTVAEPAFSTAGNAPLQAGYIAKVLLLCAAQGLARIYIYNPDGTLRENQLINSKPLYGFPNGLNQAGLAWKEVRKWLLGAHVGVPTITGNQYVIPITRPSGYSAVAVWDASGGPSNYTAPGTTVQQRGLDGTITAITGGSTVVLGLLPVLIENQSIRI